MGEVFWKIKGWGIQKISSQVEACKLGLRDESLPALIKDMQARHMAWLTRGRDAKGHATWRKKKLHRQAAKKWILSLDNQLRYTTGKGIEQFLWKAGLPWDQQSHLSIGMDLGSDGNCGFHGWRGC